MAETNTAITAMIRTILFDLDNTLIDRDEAFRQAVACLLAVHEVSSRDRQRIAREIIAADRSMETGALCAWLAERWPALGRDGALVLANLHAEILRRIRPDPAIQGLLETLREAYALVLVSDGGSRTQRGKLARAGLEPFFSHVVISGEVVSQKPDPAIFRHALALAGVEPGEALFVGDHPIRDILGARRLGMSTAWIRRGRRWAEADAPTWILERVTDLPEVLDG